MSRYEITYYFEAGGFSETRRTVVEGTNYGAAERAFWSWFDSEEDVLGKAEIFAIEVLV